MKNKHTVLVRSNAIWCDGRCTKIIETLQDEGYKISLIAWDKSQEQNAKEKIHEAFGKDVDAFVFSLVGNNNCADGNIKALLKFFVYVEKTLKLINEKRSIDIIHACDIDGELGVIKFSKKHKIPLILDEFDIYPLVHNLYGFKQKMAWVLNTYAENNADKIIVCTKERDTYVSTKNQKKIVHINNLGKEINQHFEKEFDLAITGEFEDGRLIPELLEKACHDNTVQVIFAGKGKYETEIKNASKDHSNIHFVGQVAYKDMLRLEGQSKIIAAYRKQTKETNASCDMNKFYEAGLLNLMIVTNKEVSQKNLIGQYLQGHVTDYDSDEAWDAILKLLKEKKKPNNKSWLEKPKRNSFYTKLGNLYKEVLE